MWSGKKIYLEKEGLTFLQNTTTFLPDYKIIHPPDLNILQSPCLKNINL
jgi:hypothetical protein